MRFIQYTKSLFLSKLMTKHQADLALIDGLSKN